jgi:hypothetical protein
MKEGRRTTLKMDAADYPKNIDTYALDYIASHF